MPTSNYMPNDVVEVAFNGGYNVPAASWTWTDVSDYLELAELITINIGRGDERSTADANTCTLVLDNRDRRFTPGYTGGPYGSNVKLGRPIRVRATPVDGAVSTRFLGFIDEIELGWTTGTDAYAAVTVSASSRLSRLGQTATLKSIIEQAILVDAPVAYYTFGEAVGAGQANDSSGNKAAPLPMAGVGADVVFGNATGPGTDSLTAATFAWTGVPDEAKSLYGNIVATPAAGGVSIETFFLNSFVGNQVIAFVVSLTGESLSLFMNGAGQVMATAVAAGVPGGVVSPLSYNDGATHHAAGTWDGTTVRLYIDGALVASTAFAGTVPSFSLIAVGGSPGGLGFNGTLAHMAFYNTKLSDTSIASHASAGLTGYAGETTSDRISRYLAYMGVEAAALSAETGQITVQHVDTTGKQAVELMRLMETTEGGVLFDARDGILMFQNRAHRLVLASSYTLDMAQHMVESDYAPKLDRSALVNDVTATDTAGQFSAHVFDSASQTDNGVAATSIETAAQDDDEPLFQVSWALYKYKTPSPRVASLSVDVLAQVGKTPNCATVMATNVGDKITVSNQPSQAVASTSTYFVEGWTEVHGPESLRITFNVSPTSPDDQTLVIGDATRGVIGTNPVAL
jgi:hypothetical protein